MEEKEEKKTKKEQELENLKNELKEELKKEMYEEMKTEEQKENKGNNFEKKAKETIDKIMDTQDDTKDYDKKDIESNKGLAMISYFGPLALIPFLVSKDSKYVSYHAKQGLNLFIIELIIGVFSYFISSIIQIPKMCQLFEYSYECGSITPWWITLPISILEAVTFILAIVGIVYACQGKAKELPVIGKIKIIK